MNDDELAKKLIETLDGIHDALKVIAANYVEMTGYVRGEVERVNTERDGDDQ